MTARAARIVTVAGALLAAGALAIGVLAALRHDEIRAAWADHAADVERVGYDATRSDTMYAAVLEHRAQAERAAWIAVIGVVLSCAGIGARPRAVRPGTSAPRRAWAALAIDALALAAGLAIASGIRDALGADHAAFGALAARSGHALALGGGWAALAAGSTPGGLALGVRLHTGERSPGLARAAAMFALAPLALVVAPFALAIGARRGAHRLPWHLRWTGVEATRGSLDGARGSE